LQVQEFTRGDVVAVAGADWLGRFETDWRDGWVEVVFDGQPIPSRHTSDRVCHPCGACLTRFQDGFPREDRYCAACHTDLYWERTRRALRAATL
jgi:hypothetical protein